MKFKFYSVLENKTKIIKPVKGESVKAIIKTYYGSSFNYEILVKEVNKKFYIPSGKDYKLKNISDVTVFLSPKGSQEGNGLLGLLVTIGATVAFPGAGLAGGALFKALLLRGATIIAGSYAINKFLPIKPNDINTGNFASAFLTKTNQAKPLGKVPQFYGEGVVYPAAIAPINILNLNQAFQSESSRQVNATFLTLGRGFLQVSDVFLNGKEKPSADFVSFNSGSGSNYNDADYNSHLNTQNPNPNLDNSKYNINRPLFNTTSVFPDNSLSERTTFITKPDETSDLKIVIPKTRDSVRFFLEVRTTRGVWITLPVFGIKPTPVFLFEKLSGQLSTYPNGWTVDTTGEQPLNSEYYIKIPDRLPNTRRRGTSTRVRSRWRNNIRIEDIGNNRLITIKARHLFAGGRGGTNSLRIRRTTGTPFLNVYFNTQGAQLCPRSDNGLAYIQSQSSFRAGQVISCKIANKILVPSNIPINYNQPVPQIRFRDYRLSSNFHKNPAYIILNMLIEAEAAKKINLNFLGNNPQIDFISFERWARFCATKSFFVSKIFVNNQNLEDAITTIAQIGFGKIIRHNGRYRAIIDTINTEEKIVISPSNARDFSFNLAADKSFHGVKISYISNSPSTPNLQVATSYCRGFNSGNSTNFLKFNYELILSSYHADKMANYFVKSLQNRNETLTCEMDLAYLTVSPGDLVLVGGMDIVNPQILSSIITKTSVQAGTNITNLSLSNSLNLVAGESYKVTVRRLSGEIINLDEPFVVRTAGEQVTNLEELSVGGEEVSVNNQIILIQSVGEETGNTSNITIVTLSGFIFYKNDLLFIKADNQQLKKYIVESVIPKDNISASISLLEYNPAVYQDL